MNNFGRVTTNGAMPSVGDGMVMPTRSTLVRLEPIGQGGRYRECLSSYLMRLADVHSLRPRVIVRELMKPYVDVLSQGCRQENDVHDWFRSPRFDGTSATVLGFIRALEALTLRGGLSAMTLLPMRAKGIPHQGIVAKVRKWCPLCFQHDRKDGIPYLRLLWGIEDVKACPLHRIRLTDQCGCAEEDQLHYGLAKAIPGLCGKCGRELGRDGTQWEDATDDDVVRAGLIADFLVKVDQATTLDARRGLMAFLTNSIELHFKGSAVALAKAMGVQKHSLHGWHRGNHFPTFRQLVSIANIHGCSLMDVCSGDAMTINRIPDSRIPTAIPSRRASPRDIDWPEVQMKLEAVVTAPTAPCLYEVARMLNLAARTLRTKFPDLSKRISSRNKEFKTADLHYRLEEHRLWIRSSADDMVAEGLRPTPKAVIARLDVPYQFFWHDIKMVRQICAAVAQDQPS